MNVPRKQTKSPSTDQGFDLAAAYKALIGAYMRRHLKGLSLSPNEKRQKKELSHEKVTL